ncbi:TetR/AcrR family transcriptional regulator [Chengkuizengella axinellae]|uniref:TetR/AcrR family transcriptional regulator n=1 Tax=Chengkuizengella axinellae TaxID=3064388 RepID=A0ABT9J4C6_9BACL|nr:TetR/AcrR family transcriptional regulator [Chengkuizengella sp. 2205SS18-9]MDP5276490.1 TetR/AcrR family transcriptional regulator [Chengkuizengella sp. 2205SS18-9]
MTDREKIMKAAFRLASEKPFDKITLSEIAKEVDMHWSTVRRQFGNKQELKRILSKWQAENDLPQIDTRTQIIEASSNVFSEKGYARATLDEVAKKANLTKGAVYWHFSSKQDLFLALVDRNISHQLKQIPSIIKHILSSNDSVKALSKWFESQFTFVIDDENKQMLMLEFITSSREPIVKNKLNDAFSKILIGTELIVQEMQDKNLISNQIHPKSVSVLIQSIINGVIQTWIINPEQIQKETLVSDISHILWEGIKP